MDNNNNQPGAAEPQRKVNPQSPNFMAGSASPGGAPSPGTPNTPPSGGSAVPPMPPSSPPPPPPPPAPTPGSGSGAVPPPPPKQMNVRTMQSDQDSLKASGGMNTQPKAVNLGGPTPPPAPGKKKVDSAGRQSGGKKKALIMGGVIVLIIAAAAAVANYVVFPLLFSDVEVAEIEELEIPVEEEQEADVAPPTPDFAHQSYFQETLDTSEEVNLSSVTLPNIDEGLVALASGDAAQEAGSMTEFNITQGVISNPVSSDEMLGILLPDTSFATPMEEDFTGFLYSDGETHFPGYIFALDVDVQDKEGMKEVFNADLESSQALTNLFLEDPGVPDENGFQDGVVVADGGTSRWISFSEEGVSVSYAWKGDFLVLSTSFDGFKAAVNALGDATAPAPVEEEPEEEPVEEQTEEATSTPEL